MTHILKFEKNTRGVDYCVGDIHGTFDRLKVFLDKLGFNYEHDRLFSVGDLVSRGPNSEDVLDWLCKPWFHPVTGNHERMVIDAYEDFCGAAEGSLFMNGGAWWFAQPKSLQDDIVWALRALPIALEVPVGDKVFGIVHSDVPFNDWDRMKENILDPTVQNHMLWDRQRQNEELTSFVKGVDYVLTGHTPVTEALTLGNVINLDTGAVFKGRFTEHPNGLTIFNMTDFEFYKEIDYV